MDQMPFVYVIFVSFPEAILVGSIGLLLVGFRPTLRSLLLIGAMQAVISFFVRRAPIPFGVHTIILVALFILVLRLVTRLPFWQATLAGVLGLLTELSIETVVAPLMPYLFGHPFSQVATDLFVRVLYFAPEAAIMGLVVYILARYNISLLVGSEGYSMRNVERNYSKERGYFWGCFLVILPISLLAIENFALEMHRLGIFRDNNLEVLIVFVGVSVQVLAPLSILAVRRIGLGMAAELELKKSAEALTQIEELVLSGRKQRHDFTNHLQTIYGLLETSCYDQARVYLGKIFNAVSITSGIVQTDSIPVSALLYAKCGVAEARGINMEIAVECSLKEIALNSQEITSLLGNLIDNAFEAIGDLAPEDKRVGLHIYEERGWYVINVANRGMPISPSIEQRIFEPHFTTKPDHSGLGLAVVKDIVGRYGGEVELKSQRGEVAFAIRVPQ